MANAKVTTHMRLLQEQLDAVRGEIAILQGKAAGLEAAMRIISDEPTSIAVKDNHTPRPRRSSIKDHVLRITQQHEDVGVVAADIVEIANPSYSSPFESMIRYHNIY